MFKTFLLCIISFVAAFTAKAQNNYNEVTLPELLKKLQQKDPKLVILDVRSPGEYFDTSSRFQQSNIGHIKGAINISIQDFRKDPATVHKLDAYREKDIYVICSHSYRSRVVSNILLDSGFRHVNNTRGGMTEFFRRFNEVAPYKNDFYETSVSYKNIAPAELLQQLSGKKNPLLISIGNTAKFSWDSLNLVLYRYYPSFKNEVNFNYADSLTILRLAEKEKDRQVVLFNNTNYGAAELAGWLTEKGIRNVAYLVGGADLFYEYLADENLISLADKFLAKHSSIRFMTPSLFCNQEHSSKDTRIIDLRPDTLFDKVTKGTKHNYKHLKDAVNFFAGKGREKFEQQFPDKRYQYILISGNGVDGLEFADSLAKDGYKISWMNGGLQEWEWYMNNVETFKCTGYLVD
jgi:rhodanese-related sulfurtransferase